MKRIVGVVCGLGAAMAATGASAQGLPKPSSAPATSLSVGYTYADGGAFAEFGVLTSRFTGKFGYFGVETEAGVGIAGSSGTVLGVPIQSDLKYTLSGYGLGFLPLSNQFQLLGRVGYGTSRVKVSSPTGWVADNIESFNFGAGALVSLDEHNHFRADYTRYDTEGAGGANGWSISYVRKF